MKKLVFAFFCVHGGLHAPDLSASVCECKMIFDEIINILESIKSTIPKERHSDLYNLVNKEKGMINVLEQDIVKTSSYIGMLKSDKENLTRALEADIKRLEDRNQDLMGTNQDLRARNQDLTLDKQNLSVMNQDLRGDKEYLRNEIKNMKRWYPTTINSVVYLGIGVVGFCFLLDVYYTCYGGPPCEFTKRKNRHKPAVTVTGPVQSPVSVK